MRHSSVDFESTLFLVGPVLGPVAVMVAALVVSVGFLSATRPLIVLAAIEGVLVVAHWSTWWFAFDWVNGEAVPNRLFDVTTGLMAAAAAGCLALVWAMATTARRSHLQQPSGAQL